MIANRALTLLFTALAITAGAVAFPADEKITATWTYKAFSFASDEAKASEKLNHIASQGWEYVGPIGNGLIAFRRMPPLLGVALRGNVCPCSAWSLEVAPSSAATSDSAAVELGVRFSVGRDGLILGIRFFKSEANEGRHVGSLWSDDGKRMATAVFSHESPSGWQQVRFETPVPIKAGVVYVASYHAPEGRYTADSRFFADQGVESGPVTLLQDGIGGSNGVYAYSAESVFPDSSFDASNYWVDVIFATRASGTAPEVTGVFPVYAASGVDLDAVVEVTFDKALDPALLKAPNFAVYDDQDRLVPGMAAYDVGSGTATLTPVTQLKSGMKYTVRVLGGGVIDMEGNALGSTQEWSFTTTASDLTFSEDAPIEPDANTTPAPDRLASMAVAVAPRGSEIEDEIKDALAEIQGKWYLVSLEREGVKERNEIAGYTLTFTGTEFSIELGPKFAQSGTIDYQDANSDPRAVSLTVTEGLGVGEIMMAIYAVDQDILKFGIGRPGADRPSDFETTAGGRYTSVWKRADQ